MSRSPLPGDYGVTPGGGLAMWLVRAGTGRPPLLRPAWAGHAAICVGNDPDTGRTVIVEATPDKGVRSRTLRFGEEWVWSAEQLTAEQRRQLVSEAARYDGVPYDWPSITAFVIRFWVKQFKGHAQDHPDEKLFCSEFVAWLYRDRMTPGLDLVPGVAPGTTAPADLYRRMQLMGWA